MVITLVRQGYKSMESKQDYRTETWMIYRERGISIDIGKAKDNFDKDKKLKCFNYNIYRYIVKNCQKPNKEKDTRKCYKCNKIRHIVKDCISEQKIKNCSV